MADTEHKPLQMIYLNNLSTTPLSYFNIYIYIYNSMMPGSVVDHSATHSSEMSCPDSPLYRREIKFPYGSHCLQQHQVGQSL